MFEPLPVAWLPSGESLAQPRNYDFPDFISHEVRGQEQCTICHEPFAGDDHVCRLSCRHMFHTRCWDNMTQYANVSCPNCRGPGDLIAAWRYVADGPDTQEVNGHPVPNEARDFVSSITQRLSCARRPSRAPSRARSSTPTRPRSTSTSPARARPSSAPLEAALADIIDVEAGELNTQGLQADEQREEEGEISDALPDPPGLATTETPATVETPATPELRQDVYYEYHYHTNTRLADGRPAIVIDPGSVGNLCGDRWAKRVAQFGHQNGMHPTHHRRARPLEVAGVGHGTSKCTHDCRLPVAFQKADGTKSNGHFTVPAVQYSDLPGLLGLNTLIKNRAVIDFSTMKMHFCGPGDMDLEKNLPPGTETFQLERAQSGHLVLPCCEYQAPVADPSDTSELTLITNTVPTTPSPESEQS